MSPAVDSAPQDCLDVLVVGCGRIAGGFDEGRGKWETPLTHAGAYRADGRYVMSACVEPDTDRRNEFMRAWDIAQGFGSLDEVLSVEQRFDIVSICSPTDAHAEDLKFSLQLKPKLVFCEKPVTCSGADTEDLVARYRESGVLLATNYTRRWDPDVRKLKADMSARRWGELRSVVGLYSKGILNNGSHLIDLLCFLLGPLQIERAGEAVDDFTVDDPSIAVWATTATGIPVQLVTGNAQDYSIFEIQFVFSRGLLVMEDGGMSWRERRVVESSNFRGYRNLDAGERRGGAYAHAMLEAVDNIYRAVKMGAALASTGDSALLAQRICEQVKLQANGSDR